MNSRFLVLLMGGVLSLTMTGCLNLQFGGGSTTKPAPPTVGQQLIDLKRAKEEGAISPAEYEAQRARLLEVK